MDDPVPDGVDVAEPADPGDGRPGGVQPGVDAHDGGPVVGDGFDALERGSALRLEREDRFLAADLFDEPFGDTAVGVRFEEIEIGVDNLELN